MATGTVFSETLQSITAAKLAELSHKRTAFEARHSETISNFNAPSDPLARITALLEGVKRCFDIDGTTSTSSGSRDHQLEDDLRRLDRFLEQAKFDSSLSGGRLKEWEDLLVRYLDVQRRRYQYATLYGQLVTEWLSPDSAASSGGNAASTEDGDAGESFDELPGQKRMEARQLFESSVFEPADVDEEAIEHYLADLFSDTDPSGPRRLAKALNVLRESTIAFEAHLSSPNQFTTATVARSIHGLLQCDLFAGEKRTVLKNFKTNSVILSEIADVLNMRMSAITAWNWGEGGVPVEQRRRLNGRFDVYMHEDLLQAIFLQFIGVEWSVFFKNAFRTFRRAAWTSGFRQLSRMERKRREYYLGVQETAGTLQRSRRRTYRRAYFAYQLLDFAEQEVEEMEGEEEADFDEEAVREEANTSEEFSAPVPAARTMQKMKMRAPKTDDEESDDGRQMHGPKKPMERKKDLLHLLSTEAAVNKRLHGRFTAFRSVFDALHNALPHGAVMAVLKFFGVSDKWLGFFREYLEAPLRFLEDDRTDGETRTRKRGAPASHTLSDVLSETLLFCLDSSVNRSGNGAFLYRLSDDFWFWSHDHKKASTTWSEIEKFAKLMGLAINHGKSGSIAFGTDSEQSSGQHATLPDGRIRWGFMYFDPETLRFIIDQKMVDEHVEELKKQLAAKSSVFDLIQVWNAYANTFFASNFGKVANCFGRRHVNDILATHQRIQRAIFGGDSVVAHLKSTIAERFGMRDIADGFLFFPVELGGLELQSPFIAPLQIQESVCEEPSKILDRFEEAEKEDYHRLKAAFDKGQTPDARYEVENPNWKPSEGAEEFMSFEEYTRYREELKTADSHSPLLAAYDELLQQPWERSIDCSPAIIQALDGLGSHAHARGIMPSWSRMEPYWRWITQLYGPEMIEQFGGLRVVESGLLPIGIVGLFRDQKVKWQG